MNRVCFFCKDYVDAKLENVTEWIVIVIYWEYPKQLFCNGCKKCTFVGFFHPVISNNLVYLALCYRLL